MSNSISPFGQSYFGQSVVGQASNADTTPPTSVSFGTTNGVFQANASVFGSTPTSGTSAASAPGGVFKKVGDSGIRRAGSRRVRFLLPVEPSPQVKTVRTAYAAIPEVERSGDKLQSLSAMPIYSGKGHEEIRFNSLKSRENASGLFGALPVFGQSTNSTSNLSAFGSQLGGPKFDGTSNNCFETNSGSKPLLGATESAGFGGSSVSFDVSSGPSFGNISPNFGSNSVFGATASTGFGGSSASFGVFSTPSFGSSSSNFGSNSVFGVSSTSSFVSSSSNIGSDSIFSPSRPSFGSTSSNFGSNSIFSPSSRPSLESSSSNIGSNSVFGPSSGPSFGSSFLNSGSNSLFGATVSAGFGGSLPSFGVSSTPSFASSTANIGSNSIFGPPRPSFDSSSSNIGSNSIFGPSRPSFESNSSNTWWNSTFGPSFRPSLESSSSNIGSNSIFVPSFRPSFGSISSNSALGSIFGATASAGLGGSSASFGVSSGPSFQGSTLSFRGNTGFGGRNQIKGSKIESYSATSSIEDPNLKLQSLSAMGAYKDKSHEELRLEDYNASDKDQSSMTAFPSFSSSAQYNGQFPSTQTPKFTFIPQTPNNSFAPKIPSTCPPISSSFTIPSFSNGFSTITLPKSPFPDQTSPEFFSPQVPSTTCPPTTSPIMFPAPVGNAVFTNNANAGAQIPSLSTPLDSVQTGQTTNLQSPAVIGPSTSIQGPASQNTADQPMVKASPFGELPAISRLSLNQYGISSMPVKDNKPSTPVRLSSLLTSRHLSHHRMRLPARKYDSKSERNKVPFFNKGDDSLCVRASTLVPRESPRAFVVHSAEVWPHRSETEEISTSLNVSLHGIGEGFSSENNIKKEEPSNVLNKDSHEAKISKEDEIEALMPQLSLSSYYTEPSIVQLAEKEKAEPGFCSRLIDFEIGRFGYGNIKFLGETDVRNLFLDSLVEFNTREVVVYKNEDEKPPVGKGLNKLAEVTLLNITCVDKNTGKKYVDGPKVASTRKC